MSKHIYCTTEKIKASNATFPKTIMGVRCILTIKKAITSATAILHTLYWIQRNTFDKIVGFQVILFQYVCKSMSLCRCHILGGICHAFQRIQQINIISFLSTFRNTYYLYFCYISIYIHRNFAVALSCLYLGMSLSLR